MLVRCPSGSAVKLNAIRRALETVWPGQTFQLEGLAVELQDRPEMEVNAQPEGEAETARYARERRQEMRRQYGADSWLDIAIESGAIGDLDVTVVILYPQEGEEVVVLSNGIPFPPGMLDAARDRGFKTTTAGDIIHEQHPNVPGNSWQAFFPPYMSREDQIREAVERGLRSIPAP